MTNDEHNFPSEGQFYPYPPSDGGSDAGRDRILDLWADGLSAESIASQSGVPANTIYSLVSRARKAGDSRANRRQKSPQRGKGRERKVSFEEGLRSSLVEFCVDALCHSGLISVEEFETVRRSLSVSVLDETPELYLGSGDHRVALLDVLAAARAAHMAYCREGEAQSAKPYPAELAETLGFTTVRNEAIPAAWFAGTEGLVPRNVVELFFQAETIVSVVEGFDDCDGLRVLLAPHANRIESIIDMLYAVAVRSPRTGTKACSLIARLGAFGVVPQWSASDRDPYLWRCISKDPLGYNAFRVASRALSDPVTRRAIDDTRPNRAVRPPVLRVSAGYPDYVFELLERYHMFQIPSVFQERALHVDTISRLPFAEKDVAKSMKRMLEGIAFRVSSPEVSAYDATSQERVFAAILIAERFTSDDDKIEACAKLQKDIAKFVEDGNRSHWYAWSQIQLVIRAGESNTKSGQNILTPTDNRDFHGPIFERELEELRASFEKMTNDRKMQIGWATFRESCLQATHTLQTVIDAAVLNKYSIAGVPTSAESGVIISVPPHLRQAASRLLWCAFSDAHAGRRELACQTLRHAGYGAVLAHSVTSLLDDLERGDASADCEWLVERALLAASHSHISSLALRLLKFAIGRLELVLAAAMADPHAGLADESEELKCALAHARLALLASADIGWARGRLIPCLTQAGFLIATLNELESLFSHRPHMPELEELMGVYVSMAVCLAAIPRDLKHDDAHMDWLSGSTVIRMWVDKYRNGVDLPTRSSIKLSSFAKHLRGLCSYTWDKWSSSVVESTLDWPCK